MRLPGTSPRLTYRGCAAAICRVISFTNSRKFSFLATKSVSQFTSTSTPPLSTRARLQSIIPAFVFSRSCFTNFGSISVAVFIENWRVRRSASNVSFRLRGHAGHLHLLANACFVACRNDRIHKLLQNHANSANRVIVAGDWVIDNLGVRVRINDGDHWNAKASRLIHCVLLAICIDHHQSVWQLRHLDYPVEVAPELCRLAIKRSQFLFSHFLVFRRLFDLFDVFQSPDALANSREVGQRAAEPALIYIKLAASHCGLFYRFLRLLLTTDKQNFAAATRDFLEKFRGPPKLQDGLIQIDDINLVALFEDERLHLRIPTLRLVSKMNASFQQFRY